MERAAATSMLSRVFPGIAVAGMIVPLSSFLPWLIQHGLDAPRFVDELFGSRLGAFFAWDMVIAAVTVMLATAVVPGITGAQHVVAGAGTLLVAVSGGLPLLLFFCVRAAACAS